MCACVFRGRERVGEHLAGIPARQEHDRGPRGGSMEHPVKTVIAGGAIMSMEQGPRQGMPSSFPSCGRTATAERLLVVSSPQFARVESIKGDTTGTWRVSHVWSDAFRVARFMGSVWRGLRGTTLATHLGALVRTFGGERTRPATWLARRGVSSGPSHYREDELRRYVRQIRAESNETSWDDPPTAPLPETNELYEGASDFSNFLDRHEDMSPRQAYGGLALGMGFFAVLGALAFQRSKAKERPYVPREVPGYNRDIFGSDVPPDVA
eukprot:ctg_611.g331